MDLDSMKYAELRGLAKELGIKGNMKAYKLLKVIKKHYEEKNKEEEEQGEVKADATSAVQQDVSISDEENKDASGHEEVSRKTVFVNTRRGKGNGTKRKISDTIPVTDSDAKSPQSVAEGETEVVASSAPLGESSAKKRRVSSAKDSDKTETDVPQVTVCEEQQPDIKDDVTLQVEKEKAPKATRAGKIPRYQGTQQKNKPLLRPITPNFKALHEAHFKKMESIDSYVERKTKKMETYKSSASDQKKPSDKTKLQLVEGKTKGKTTQSRVSLFSPVLANKKTVEDKRRHTLMSASKIPPNKPAAKKEEALFRPSVLSTRRINVRFSEATVDNEHKKSMVKTPARMSPCVASSTPQKQAADVGKPKNIKTSALSATKTPAAFVFSGNTSMSTSMSTTPGTQKANFDLKASLSRPLSYKPHTGKLKTFGETKENTAVNKSLVENSHQKNYKQPKLQTRGDRRAKQVEDRKQKKESVLGAKRGLVMT